MSTGSLSYGKRNSTWASMRNLKDVPESSTYGYDVIKENFEMKLKIETEAKKAVELELASGIVLLFLD